jgi:outer membrane biosynthesis protein TonB
MALPSRSRHRAGLAALALAGFLAGVPALALGEPLTKEACDALADEQAKLVDGGVRDAMAGGAEGARTRLSAQKLAQVQRFLTVDEQLLFRCGQYKARFVPPPEPEEPADAAAKAAEEKAQPAKAPPAKAKPKTKPKPKTGAEKANTAEGEKAKAAPPPAKRKPKADDAYRPPAAPAPAPAQTGAPPTRL